jgi:hypothetical protein
MSKQTIERPSTHHTGEALETASGLIIPRNAFADAVTSTKFSVTNNTDDNLRNQKILVFLMPIDTAQNWTYAAWQALAPGEGSQAFFDLNQDISADALSADGSYQTASQKIAPGYVSILTNPDGLSPVLNPAVLGSRVQPPTVATGQSGIKNQTTNPGLSMYTRWSVNGKLTCQSGSIVSAGGTLSAFELETTLYWAVSAFKQGPNYNYNQITAFTKYALPANTANVDVDVTFDLDMQQFAFSFSPR